MDKTMGTTRRGMTFRTLGAFVALAFGVAWGLMGLYFAFPDELTAMFGPVGYTNPLFVLSVYAPGLAGLFLVWRHYGLKGLGSFLRRLTMWRMPKAWWAFLVLGIPAAFYTGAAIKGSIGHFPFSPWYQVLPALATGLLIGPMEEFGWRGVALPLLQRRFSPFWAGLVLAVVWGVWHLPAFFMEGTPQSAWSFGPYFLGVLAIAIIMTPLFNAGRGSILIAGLYHFQLNNPIWPDAQPWDSVVFAIVALAVVVLNRKAMFSREGAVTEVLMPGVEGRLAAAAEVAPSAVAPAAV